MKSNFANNYQQIKVTIDNNFDIIRGLINQADNLNEIVKTLNGSEEEKAKKEQMEKIIADINDNIEKLIISTGDLFELYTIELNKM